MTVVKFAHSPETIIFAVDLDSEMATEVTRGCTRLDVVKHAIKVFVHAKKRLSHQHKFGIATLGQTEACLLPYSVSNNIDVLLQHLEQLQPKDPAQFISSIDGFDLGSIATALEPLLQQQRQHQQQEEQLHIAGGTLTASPGLLGTCSSNSSKQSLQQQLRVILIYGRSALPAPRLLPHPNCNTGLAIDCLYLHSKPQPGLNNPQEVYSALEQHVDSMSVQNGHAGFVYEVTAGRTSKLLACMAKLMAHPAQRQPQAGSDSQPAVDFATAPLMPLPSDAANLASGVPIMQTAQLPVSSAASAWHKPLTVSNTVSNSSSDSNTWGMAAAAGASSSSAWGAPAAANPWVEPSHAAAAFGGKDMLLLRTSPTARTTSPPAAAGSPSRQVAADARSRKDPMSPAAAAVVTGVPATVVQGVPDRQPSYSFDDDGDHIALGFALPSGRPGAEAANDSDTAYATGSSSAAAAAARGGRIGEKLSDEELDGLAAALMASATEQGKCQ